VAAPPAIPAALDDDGWPLETSEPSEQPPESPEPAQLPTPATPLQQMPSPAAAAYEAARIVGEMVGDIESVPGAALVAAAAAGAAIEVARARVAAGEPDRSLASSVSAADAASTDPVVTVRMQRDRILRALAEDIAANATSTATAESVAAASAAAGAGMPATSDRAGSQPGAIPGARGEALFAPSLPGRAATQPGRAATQPGRMDDAGADDAADDELDPVAIAAAAIARLRQRARSDLAELRVHYQRHDIVVLLVAFVIIVVAGRIHTGIVTPPTEPFDPGGEHGLSFEHSKGWLTSVGGPLPSPRIVHELAPSSAEPSNTLYHVELTSTVDPTARIEVLIDKKPAWSNIVTGLDLDRRTRWGELYTLDDSSVRSVEDHQWLRTAYRYAHADKGDVPRIDRAVEYATIDREQIYVITLFGTVSEIERIEDVVAPTLRVATRTGLPLVPQTGHLSTRKYPNAVAHAFEATVMVVVADIIDGRLHARGGGSGVSVGRDGSILTNYHVIHDQRGRLHDVFVIGRFSEQDKAPQLFCAGKPSRGKLQRELDLALIKCDLDLDGRSWSPTSSATTWATLPQARAAEVKIGQRIWVLGYPDVGGGGLTLSEGEVEGWSGVDGAAGKDFLKTDAAIRHGNSGGPVVDDAGRLVGIASAVRTKQNASGDIIEVVQAGGRVRPIAAATDLLAIAAAGWTPREGHTDVELQPSAIEAPAEGVQIQSRVVDVANEAPVRDALVMVLRPGVNARTVDVNRLDDQVLAYGRSNAQGEVLLKQPVPVPGTYTLMVVARGYEPVIDEGDLILEASTPAVFDPWGKIELRAR
jgi:S1-C subfamily serine protease